MYFKSFTISLCLYIFAQHAHPHGLTANPIQAENTWRIHQLSFQDEEHPASKEVSTTFFLYRSRAVSYSSFGSLGSNVSNLNPTDCGWEWLTRPVQCSWGWVPEEIPNHPRNNPTEANKAWHECTYDPALPEEDRDLPKAVSTWLRYRVVDIVWNGKGVKGSSPKNAKWQVVKATCNDKFFSEYIHLTCHVIKP